MIKALDFHNDTAYLNSDRPSTSHTAAATNAYIVKQSSLDYLFT